MSEAVAQAYMNAGIQPTPEPSADPYNYLPSALPNGQEFHVAHMFGFSQPTPNESFYLFFDNGVLKTVVFVTHPRGDYIRLEEGDTTFITKPNDMHEIEQGFRDAWDSGDIVQQMGVSYTFTGIGAGGKRRKRSKKTRRYRKGSRKNRRPSK